VQTLSDLKSSPQTGAQSTTRRFDSLFGWQILTVVLLCALAYCSLALNMGKFNRAEVFFAECAREMIEASTLITPLYHGQAFFDKPILIYWLIIGSFKTFGVSHFAARLASIVTALLTIAAVGYAGKWLFGKQSGLLAAMATGTGFMFLSFANLCMSDMPLVLFDSLALGAFYAACQSARHRNTLLWSGSMLMALGFLTKGPVAIVLPSLSFAAYLTASRQWSIIKWHHVLTCSTILVLGASPWFLAAYRENGLAALSYFFLRENVQRFAGSTYDTHKPVWFMISSLFTGFLPWSVFLIPAAANLKTELTTPAESKQRPLLFLWLWVAVVTGFFSLSRGKIDYYVLPAYPAAAIIVAQFLCAAFASRARWVNVFGGAIGTKAIFATICLATTLVACLALPEIDRLQAVNSFVPTIRTSSVETRIGVYKTVDHWIDELAFQTGREPIRLHSGFGVQHFLSSPAPALVLVPEDVFATIPAAQQTRWKVMDSRPFASRPITPGYIWKTKGNIADQQLLLVSNRF
jgi:4-amino-4-deoxy-L-arabinose transferase-like glycosyltransferase